MKKGAKSAPWHVYILRCRDGTLYTGVTNDLHRRIRAHDSGMASRYTRSRRPVRLVYCERSRGRPAAQRREARIKRLGRQEKLMLIGSSRSRMPCARRKSVLATGIPHGEMR